MQEVPDFIIFLGRFHPLVVHLPIGIISVAILVEVIFSRENKESFKSLLLFVWLTGAGSALIAAIAGYLLSLGGGYDEDILSYHMWFGFILSILSGIFYLLKRRNFFTSYLWRKNLEKLLLGSMGVLMFTTGHLGGALTHGQDYLIEYAPSLVQRLVGVTRKSDKYTKQVQSLDSAYIFENAVQPILNERCKSCHNQSKKKGNLMLTSYEGIMNGGDSGPAVIPGNLTASELFRRITLPMDHKDFMPTEGKKPVAPQQVAIIEWWILNEAPRNTMLAALNPNEDMHQIFEMFFGLGKFKKEELHIPPADTVIINHLIQMGFIVRQLSEETNQLSVSILPGNENNKGIRLLPSLKDQITWLHLSDFRLRDADMEIIASLPNLVKLNVSKNPITDDGVRSLMSLSHLEYLNLYGTDISDSVLLDLLTLKNLKELYLWNTRTARQVIDSLSKTRPEVKIINE